MPLLVIDCIASLLALVSSVVFYLGCPNQQWLPKRPLPFAPAAIVSLIIAALSGWLFSFHLSAISSVFAVITLIMLLLGLLPFVSPLSQPANNIAKKSGLVKSESAGRYRPRWWLRTLGAALLTYPLAVGLSGLLGWWLPGPMTDDVKSQFVMWLITPLWLLPISLAFLTPRVISLLTSLAALNGVVYGLLWMTTSGA